MGASMNRFQFASGHRVVPTVGTHGYRRVVVGGKTHQFHRLVALAFLENQPRRMLTI
jgi:hypothetical protein